MSFHSRKGNTKLGKVNDKGELMGGILDKGPKGPEKPKWEYFFSAVAAVAAVAAFNINNLGVLLLLDTFAP